MLGANQRRTPKRVKTTRACDQCRGHKSRCEPVDDSSIPNPFSGEYDPESLAERKCKSCYRLGKECTYNLRIEETRYRDRKRGRDPNLDLEILDTLASGTNRSQTHDRRYSSNNTAPQIVPDYLDQPLERFLQFLKAEIPIIDTNDLNTRNISNSKSVLLFHCVKLLVAAYCAPNDLDVKSYIQESVGTYFTQKHPMTTPSMRNVQSLALLSLFVDEKGAGNRFITAVRMAIELRWHLPPLPQIPVERTELVAHGWWGLVSQDIWLYLYTGVEPQINYRDFNVQRPAGRSVFVALTELSEILRMLIRRQSIGEYSIYQDALSALIAYEDRYFAELFLDNGSLTNYQGSEEFDSNTLLRILHSVVISVFILRERQEQRFLGRYDRHRNQQITNASRQQQVYGQQYDSIEGLYGYSNSHHALNVLLRTLKSHILHVELFSRISYFERFSEICVLAIALIPRDATSYQTQYNYQYEPNFDDERTALVQQWQSLIGEDRWMEIVRIAEQQDRNWDVIFDLNGVFWEDE